MMTMKVETIERLKCPECGAYLSYSLDAACVSPAYLARGKDSEGKDVLEIAADFTNIEVTNVFDEGHTLECFECGKVELGESGYTYPDTEAGRLLNDQYEQSGKYLDCVGEELNRIDPRYEVLKIELETDKGDAPAWSEAEIRRALRAIIDGPELMSKVSVRWVKEMPK